VADDILNLSNTFPSVEDNLTQLSYDNAKIGLAFKVMKSKVLVLVGAGLI
jgi:hypothetical protein